MSYIKVRFPLNLVPYGLLDSSFFDNRSISDQASNPALPDRNVMYVFNTLNNVMKFNLESMNWEVFLECNPVVSRLPFHKYFTDGVHLFMFGGKKIGVAINKAATFNI